MDSHRAPDLEPPLFAHGAVLSNFVQAITEADHFQVESFLNVGEEKNNRLLV
jgi:hypothetical protein